MCSLFLSLSLGCCDHILFFGFFFWLGMCSSFVSLCPTVRAFLSLPLARSLYVLV